MKKTTSIKKKACPRLYEYRIKYNATANALTNDNYHYFMSTSAEKAFNDHLTMLKNKGLVAQDISIEKFNPYSNKWEDKVFFNEDSCQRTGW